MRFMTRLWNPLLAGPLADQASRALREIADALPGSKPRDRDVASLAGGLAGQALFYAYLALSTGEEGAADLAADLLDRAAGELASTPLPPTLYAGFPGVAWTMEHLQGRLFVSEEGEEAEDPVQEIDEALLGPLSRSPWVGEYDLIGGLAGLGVYALERLPRPTAVVLLEQVVDRLAELAEEMEEGSAWFTPPERLPDWQREIHTKGYYNLGVAHGLPGVVPVLAGACAAELEPKATTADLSTVDPELLPAAGDEVTAHLGAHVERWGLPAHRGIPVDLTPAQRSRTPLPRYCHADGTQLCPVVGPGIDGSGGYQPAPPHAPDSPSSPHQSDQEGQHCWPPRSSPSTPAPPASPTRSPLTCRSSSRTSRPCSI